MATTNSQTSNRGQRPLWLDETYEWLAGWWPALVIAAAALLLWLGFSFPRMANIETWVLLIGSPLAVLAGAALAFWSRIRGLYRPALLLGLIAIVLAFLGSEARVLQTLLPPPAFASATLGADSRDATVAVPPGVTRMRVTVHGNLGGKGQYDSMRYTLALTRDGARKSMTGTLSATVQRGQSRLGGGSEFVSIHATDIHEVELAGPGDIQMHLDRIDDQEHALNIHLAPAPLGSGIIELMLGIALLLAAAAEAMAARHGRRTNLVMLVSMAVVFTLAVSHMFNPDMPLHFTLGAMLIGLSAGGVGGWLLSAIARSTVRPPAAR